MVLVYIEFEDGKIKKSSQEAAYYAAQLASNIGKDVAAVCLGNAETASELGQYGITKVLHDSNNNFEAFDSKATAKAIGTLANQYAASNIILAFNQNGKALAPRLAVRLKAAYVPGATNLSTANEALRKAVFSGKGIGLYQAKAEKIVIGLSANSVKVQKTAGTATVESVSCGLTDDDFSVKSIKIDRVIGEIPLSEAEMVVSAGRGLKGPENWGMVEQLAKEMGAATACSRPVADMDWRPHHEHVGQTGGTIKPNLYIAIGISGAIQHLAGVSSSNTIVVINTDPEAPFFKAADYGIVGDAFEVIPKFTEAYKKFKAANQ